MTKFLAEKESELRIVIKRLEDKNINTDGKDVIIKNLHAFIKKIECDGYELLKRLRQGELK